jgi:hypothetical protein
VVVTGAGGSFTVVVVFTVVDSSFTVVVVFTGAGGSFTVVVVFTVVDGSFTEASWVVAGRLGFRTFGAEPREAPVYAPEAMSSAAPTAVIPHGIALTSLKTQRGGFWIRPEFSTLVG